jgi:hypothetical protein
MVLEALRRARGRVTKPYLAQIDFLRKNRFPREKKQTKSKRLGCTSGLAAAARSVALRR